MPKRTTVRTCCGIQCSLDFKDNKTKKVIIYRYYPWKFASVAAFPKVFFWFSGDVCKAGSILFCWKPLEFMSQFRSQELFFSKRWFRVQPFIFQVCSPDDQKRKHKNIWKNSQGRNDTLENDGVVFFSVSRMLPTSFDLSDERLVLGCDMYT